MKTNKGIFVCFLQYLQDQASSRDYIPLPPYNIRVIKLTQGNMNSNIANMVHEPKKKDIVESV